jgi:hypothetical protein
MAQEQTEKPKLFVPQNRKGVSDWAGGGGANYIGLSDFGRFRLAFKKLHFEKGQTGKLFYAADCKVLSAEPVEQPKQPEAREANPAKRIEAYTPMPEEKYQAILANLEKQAREGKYRACWTDPRKKHVVGGISVITFPVGSSPTTDDPEKADREDRVLGEFLRVIQGMPRGSVVDFGVLEKLDKAPALPMGDDSEGVFDLDCIPSAKPNVIKDPATGEVLRVSISVWPNRYYRLVG